MKIGKLIGFQDSSNLWMSRLPNQLISELTIPGTHDSCCNVDCGIRQTQTLPLEEQLALGIRFFDIRCRHVHNSFDIYHEYVYCEISLQNVLDILRRFLREFPSECCLMRIKEEYLPTDCSRQFSETFEEYYQRNKDFLYLKNEIPFLDDLRGKILVICDFESQRTDTFSWNMPFIQDYWEINSREMAAHKVKKIKDHALAAIGGNKKELYLNFLSGVGETVWPKDIAKITNKTVFKYQGRLGVVIFDFPSNKNINHVISQNYLFSPSPYSVLKTHLDLDNETLKMFTKFLPSKKYFSFVKLIKSFLTNIQFFIE